MTSDADIETALPQINQRAWLEATLSAFLRGIDSAVQTIVVPYALTIRAIEGQFDAIATSVKLRELEMKEIPSENRAAFEEEYRRRTRAYYSTGSMKEVVQQAASDQLARLASHPKIESAFLHIRHAGVLRAWAALESFASDAWEAALNSADSRIRSRLFDQVTKTETADGSLVGKQIDVSVLAKHGFDLREKLGTILLKKFDFTSARGIQKAFKVFKGKARTAPPDFDDLSSLDELEAKRHVIVHAGGVVDRDYATTKALPPESVGQPLSMTDEEAHAAILTIKRQGVVLATGLATWFEDEEALESARS